MQAVFNGGDKVGLGDRPGNPAQIGEIPRTGLFLYFLLGDDFQAIVRLL